MSYVSGWYEIRPDGVILKVHALPKASRSETAGLIGEPPRLKIRIAAPPVDGEANAELLRFLKKSIRVPGARFTLVRGQTSKMKDVLCEGVSESDILASLAWQ